MAIAGTAALQDRSTRARLRRGLPASVAAAALTVACSSTPEPPPARAAETEASSTPDALDERLPPVASPYDALPPAVRAELDQPFTGDLPELVSRRLIRAGVVFNRTQYFIDRGVQRGIVYESLRLFEEQLNLRQKTGNLQVHVAFVPLARDQLFPALLAGKVDLIAAALTITPERSRMVSFSRPTRAGVSEIVVTPRGQPPLTNVDDLSGKQVFVRRSSSYFDSLTALNRSLDARGKPPVVIAEAPEILEDDDLLEMVNAALVPAIVVDDYVAEFWTHVFPNLQLHQAAAVRTGGTIAVAVRNENPALLSAVNAWIEEYGPRTTFGNMMNRRYLEGSRYATSATSESERRKFETVVELFRKYSDRYGLDFLLMAAQGYQESQLDHGARSRVGAIGIMQVMPATGKELGVGDITELEANVHAGIKYVRLMMDQAFGDEPIDDRNKLLLTLASYNAGPGRVRQLRREAVRRGLDPDVWFGNVERVASERIGRETVQYVSNIYKYYVAYRLAMEQAEARRRLKTATAQP